MVRRSPSDDDLDERQRFRLAASATARSLNQWPLLLVLAALAASCAVLATGHWRKGAFAAGCAVLLASLLRLVLPDKTVGLLAVRTRLIDVLTLGLCGAAMLILTMIVPHSSPPS